MNCNYFPELRIRIQKHSEHHEYNTKGRNLFKNVDIVRLRICQRSFLNYGINAWNLLIPEIKGSNSIHKVKTLMKQHLLFLD